MEMWLTTLLLVLLASINHVFTFPDGAPIEGKDVIFQGVKFDNIFLKHVKPFHHDWAIKLSPNR